MPQPIAAIEATAQHDVSLYTEGLDTQEAEMFAAEWRGYISRTVPTPKQAIQTLLSEVPQRKLRALHARITAWVRGNFRTRQADYLCGIANRYLPLRGIPEFEQMFAAEEGQERAVAIRIVTALEKPAYTDVQRLEIGKWLEKKIALFSGNRDEARREMLKLIPKWEKFLAKQEAAAKQIQSAELTQQEQPAAQPEATQASEPGELLQSAANGEDYVPSEPEIVAFMVQYRSDNPTIEFIEDGGMRNFAIQQLVESHRKVA